MGILRPPHRVVKMLTSAREERIVEGIKSLFEVVLGIEWNVLSKFGVFLEENKLHERKMACKRKQFL